MPIAIQVTARNFELSDAIEGEIRRHAEKLEQFYTGITRCRVVVEVPHRHRKEGKLYDVRVDLHVPGREIVIKREPNEDIYVAVRDAFAAASRQLEDAARRERGDVKRHEPPAMARVTTLFPEKGYGFLTTPDGREVYFHENSVINDGFRRLSVGAEVRFVEEMGDKGPQASTVSP